MGNGCSSEKSLHVIEDTGTNSLHAETNNNKRKSLLTKESEKLRRNTSTSTVSTTDEVESKRNSLVIEKELPDTSYQQKYQEFEKSRRTGIMERGFGNHLLGNHLLRNVEENKKLERWNSFDSDLNKKEDENQFYLEIGDVENQDTKNTLESKVKNLKKSLKKKNSKRILKAMPSKTSLVPSNTSSYDSSNEDNEWLTAIKDVFTKFAKFGQILASGKEMYQISWNKFCKDCKFVDNINLVTGDIDIIFIKNRVRGQRYIDFSAFMKCVDEIADRRLASTCKDPLERREIIYKKIMGVDPDLKGVTQSSRSRNVRRMTDHNLYPIIHKLRFDETRFNANDHRFNSLANLNNQAVNRRRTSILSLASSDISTGSPPTHLYTSKLSTLAS